MKQGFSILELLIVLTIILVTASITLPRMNFISSIILHHEIQLLAETCTYLRQRAITTNTSSELVFDITHNCYTYQATEEKTYQHKLPQQILFGFFPNAMGPPTHPSQPITHAVTFLKKHGGQPSLVFLPEGNASAGTVYLIDKNQRYMKALSCPVEETSLIRIYSYRNGKWLADTD